MVCKRCGSTDVLVHALAEQKKRGCFAACVWWLLAICTLGAIIWIPLLIRKGSRVRTYAVCQRCGRRWRV